MLIRRRAMVSVACALAALASPVRAKTALSLVQQFVDGKTGVDTLGGAAGVGFDASGGIRFYVASREGTLSLFTRELDGLLTFDLAARQGIDGADGLVQASVLA